jgi:hypothetical protein
VQYIKQRRVVGKVDNTIIYHHRKAKIGDGVNIAIEWRRTTYASHPLYLTVPTILTSTFFFLNFALNKRQLDSFFVVNYAVRSHIFSLFLFYMIYVLFVKPLKTSGCPWPSATIGTYCCHLCFHCLILFKKNIYPFLFLSVGLKIGHIRTDRFLFFRKDTLRKLAPPSQPGSFEISYLARFS